MESAVEKQDERAADWLQRLDDPQLSEADLQSWLEWFGASDSNRRTFEELQTLRQRFRELPQEYREQMKLRMSVAPATRVDRAEFRERLGLIGRPRAPRNFGNRVGLLATLAASVAVVALGVSVWWKAPVEDTVYVSPSNHHRTVTLADGSSAVLGPDSAVSIAYSQQRRTLKVERGAAYFEVRVNPGRPFVVKAGDVSVTALGTAFNVARVSDRVTVTVTEGKVAVAHALAHGAVKTLTAGQRTTLRLDAPTTQRSPASSAGMQGWTGARAQFVNAPLSEVVVAVNRYAPEKLVIADPRVADLTYSGTILRSHIDEWIASLPSVYPIDAVPMEDGAITLVSRN